ncbi:MAG: hypothetical protein EHM19_05240, partial [Candidatus Latescibacterota bacterium]
MRKGLLLPLVFLFAGSPSDARTWHVRSDGLGDAPTIQAGIDSAAAGDTVELACGVYGERNIHMKSGICLRSETGDPACATIDAHGVGRVLICEVVDDNATIEGLTITGGHAVGSHPDHHGGGIYLYGSSPRIRHCLITENRADWLGGGMMLYLSGTPEIEDCTFRSNHAFRGGGIGVYVSSPQFFGCVIEENEADNWGGGALAGEDSFGKFERCEFLRNRARGDGGGVRAFDNSTGFVECEFRENVSEEGDGGGIVFLQSDGPRSRLVDCLVTGNQAVESGGVRIDRSTTDVQNCTITGNVALEVGGGLHIYEGADPAVEGCVISGNRAISGGGLMVDYWSEPTIERTTIVGNEAKQSGAGIYSYDYSHPVIRHCIVAFSTEGDGVACLDHSSVLLSCVDVYGNAGGDYVGCIREQYGVNGNFSADPLFCDAPLGDFTLAATSPCLPGHHPDGDDCDLV